jgi:predicted transposase YbfD/YdcC
MADYQLQPEPMLSTIRGHWSIENSLHHVLDRSWNEDKQRTSSRTQGLNLKLLRQMALNLLRQIFAHQPNLSMPVAALTFLCNLQLFLS